MQKLRITIKITNMEALKNTNGKYELRKSCAWIEKKLHENTFFFSFQFS